MKKKISIFVVSLWVLLSYQPSAMAQESLIYTRDAGCLGDVNWFLEGWDGDRNYYRSENFAHRLSWDTADQRWEVYSAPSYVPSTPGYSGWFYSSYTSIPNPPDLETGNWQSDEPFFCFLLNVEGPGTQDFLQACEPMISCPPDITLACGADTSPTNTGMATGNDNCGGLSFTHDDFFVGTCGNAGTINRLWTATSEDESSSTCTQVLSIVDMTAPMALCQDITVEIDENETGAFSAEDIDAGSSDQCGSVLFSLLSPSSFSCDDIGSNFSISLIVTDQCNLSSSCTANLTVLDPNSNCCNSPSANCTNITVALDESGNTSVTTGQINMGSMAECGVASETVLPNAFNCGNLGPNTVTYTLTDLQGSSSSCMAIVEVEDPLRPTISCPADLTVGLDPELCAGTFTVPNPSASDNCAVTTLRYRHRLVDQQGADVPGEGWSSWTTESSLTLDARSRIQWQAKDAAGNQRKCSFIADVIDDEAPVPVCLHPTIVFNGEQEIYLVENEVWDELASSDNCGTVLPKGITPDKITCNQLGQTIPVLVTVEDAAGQIGTCIANVTVAGLPCGWSADPAGINCSQGSQAAYDPTSGTFSIQSEGCHDPNYYSNEDSQSFASTELCGDGEIIAQVNQLDGSGWAGIAMREDQSTGAKMMQLSINNGSLSKRELRQTTGALAFTHLFPTLGRNWLRLVRTGNQFAAYHSEDGANWAVVMVTVIPMANCIEVGLFSENASPSGSFSAHFQGVQVNLINALEALEVIFETPASDEYDQLNDQLTIYPNPTVGEVMLDLESFIGKSAQIRIFNNQGQQQRTIRVAEITTPGMELDLRPFTNGLYLIHIQIEGVGNFSKKMLLLGQ